MRTVSPGVQLRLWVFYEEDGEAVTGLTDLTVSVKDAEGNVVLASQSLIEGVSGEYSYTWDTAALQLGLQYFIYYLKGTEVLDIEEIFCDLLDDMDGLKLRRIK